MDPLVRQIENATHQRNDVFRVANQDGPTSLTRPEARGPCPTCGQALSANGRRLDVLDAAALPAGVRFDPSDEELLRHLASKVGRVREPPHRLIDDFISHLEGEEGICQTHPEKLPGVKKDGSSRHFFHKPAKAYTTGTRKRRKILNEDDESGVETRWHKTGKTRPVTDGGEQLGWKKIMVLYKNSYSGKKKAKSEKTNWILHQYHLGPDEEERDDELVVCKVFYQKQPRQCTGGRQTETATADVDSSKPESSQAHTRMVMEVSTGWGSDASRGTLITPKRDAPHRPQFSPHRSTGVSPPSQVNLEPVAVITPTQSGRGSDMSLNPCLNPWSLQSGEGVHCVRVETRRENGSPDLNEEVSTCARACGNGNALIVVDEPPKDDDYVAQTCVAAQLQAPESGQDLIDIPELLRCTEELDGTSFFPEFWTQSLEPDGILDEGHAFEGVINPNPDYPFYEDMLTSTPPAISSDMKFSSQEVSAFFSGECEFDLNDNSDSLSST